MIIVCALAGGGLGGCTDLSYIEANSCGNRVVESEAGEDCDGEASCGAPTSENACRYTCGSEGSVCPVGFGCGIDGVCRRPAGELVPVRAETTVTARDLLVGDINGDGCAEAVITAARSTVITAFASEVSDTCVAAEQTLQRSRPDAEETPLPQPALVDLSADDEESRLSLMAGSRGLYEDGLSVYFTSGAPTVSPVLFPLFGRPGASPRTLTLRLRGRDAMLLFEQPSGGAKADVTLVVDPGKNPETFAGALPFSAAEIAVAVAGDVWIDPTPDAKPCDEVVIAKNGDAMVFVFRVCGTGETNGFTALQSPDVDLDSGAKVRAKNAQLVLADMNDDGYRDLVTNASDMNLHVAYGFGDGRFHSQPTLPPAPAMPDGKTSLLDVAGVEEAELAREDRIFVVGEFDVKNAGVELVGIPCPPSDLFESPTCAPQSGGCEAVVADIDADGDDDIVSTEGQEIDVVVRRRIGDGAFHVSSLGTSCPPHHLGVGDLDGDGVNDIAFFDQTSKGPGQNATSLSIAYGNASGGPSAPVASGRFDEAADLSVVGAGPSGLGAQLAVARTLAQGAKGSAVGFVEVGDERAVAAPYYFPDASGSGPLKRVSFIAQTPGKFATDAPGGAGVALAVVTQSESNATELWLVGSNEDAGSLRAELSSVTDVPCGDSCMLVAVPATSGGADRLLLLGEGKIVAYDVEDGKFVMRDEIATDQSFSSVISDMNPKKYAARPLVADFDGDTFVDVIARAATGELVGLFGRGDGGFDVEVLLSAPSCSGDGSCGGFSVAQIDVDADGSEELAVAGPGVLAVYEVSGNTSDRLVPTSIAIPPMLAPAEDADFTALAAADVDGDGVEDLFLMPSSNFFTVLRGRPERE
jgi:hypothetical protein